MKPETDVTKSNPEGSNSNKSKKLLLVSVISVVILAVAAGAIFFLSGIREKNVSVQIENDITPTPAQTTVPSPDERENEAGMGYELEKPFELVPEDSDDTGTAVDSGYRILLDKYEYTTEELLNKITISPQTDFTVKKSKDNEYLLTPFSMKPNKVYSINFADGDKGISYSWAFQTRNEFYVTGTLPRDKATYVPVNTGIEITFSHKVENDLSQYFEITPKVKGRFEIHKNTVAFVPLSPLEHDTVYTVTLKKDFAYKTGAQALREETVFAFQTEHATVDKSDRYSRDTFEFARRIYNFYPYEVPLLSVYTNISTTREIEFSLYSYRQEEDFKEDFHTKDDRPSWCVRYDEPIDYQGKDQVLSMKTNFLHDEEDDGGAYYRTKFIQLPQTLPEGHYIAVIKIDDMEKKALIQINAMAVYVGSAVNKTIALVYESETATPVSGAEVIFGNFTMQTGQDGLAVSENSIFTEGSSRVKHYTVKREGHPGYYATFGESYYSSYYYYDYDYYYSDTDNFNSGSINDLYWGYLFTDREMYMPDDTVNIWGMLADKDGNNAPDKVRIVMSRDLYSYNSSYEFSVIDEKEVMLTGTNTFKTAISFKNLSQGYYYLQVFSEDKLLMYKYIYVKKYVKPIYTINTSVDQHNVMLGDTVEFTMETKFFEGTPVNGMNFNYYVDGSSMNEKTGNLRTDENGRAKLEITADWNTDSWYPRLSNIRVSNSDPEETSVNAYESFTIFPRDIMVDVNSRFDENMITVNVETNKINIDGIRYKEWYSEKDYKGDPVDVDFEVDLYEVWYTSTQNGTYYNFITKKTYPRYTYERHESKTQTLKLSTINGKAEFNVNRENDKGYYIILRCTDRKGLPVRQTTYLYDYRVRDTYYLWRQTTNYNLIADKTSCSVNDMVKLALFRNNEPVEKEAGKKVLFMLFRKGLLDYELTEAPVYILTFLDSYIPNVGVMAVYFDGKNFKSAPMRSIYFKREDRKLNIKVTPSQQQYRPGDTAVFDLEVTDPSGKGRKAEVLLSIVDEAYFALREQSVNTLNSIYSQNVSYGYKGESIPHTDTLEDYDYYGGAECGEGGDEGFTDIRSDFRDTAMFESVMTDENGYGQISVKLPDNLTKWRITFLGLTDDLYAGSGKINVDVRLPYFINTVFNNVFIAGDKPVLQVRSFGTDIKEGDEVHYMVKVEKDGEDWGSYSASSTVGQRAMIELDSLEEGKYTYTVNGKYGSHEDAIRLPFEVLPGFVEQSLTEYQTLSKGIVFPETKWPARVYFFNENVGSYWNELIELSYSWSDRIDSIIVRKQARTLLREFFKDRYVPNAVEYDISRYQLGNGGIALLPYASADPVLSAKICSLNDSGFDYESLKAYFYRTLTSNNATSTDIAASYWGLACLKEPVLLELNALSQSPDFKLIDRLYIALAYAYIGDLNSARSIYQDIIRNYMKEDSLRAFIEIKDEGYDSDDIQEATSLCALLAQKVNGAESSKLFEYVCNMYPTDILTNAMRLAYIKSNLKNLNMESSFVWELDGKKEKVDIKGRDTYSMFLMPEKLKSIKFSDIKGKIVVSTIYTAPIGEISKTDDRISITRTYSNRTGVTGTSFDSSEYVKISLKVQFEPTAPTGVYMVEDYLPASLRHVYSWREANSWSVRNDREWYPHEVSGQKVSFYIYHKNRGKKVETIEYFARVYNIGEFTADNAAVFNLESNIINYTPRDRIKVK